MISGKKTRFLAAAVVVAVLLLDGCAFMKDTAAVLALLKRLEFKLSRVRSFNLLGIALGGKAALTDFTTGEGVALLRGFQEKKLPAEITLDVLVRNPNDGTGGSTKTVSTLTGLESRLLINGNPTVYGNIDSPIQIPGTGQASTVPIRFSVDLYEFFGSQGYEGLIDTALALGGSKASAARIALDAQPTVTTPLGVITYPGRITIVDKEFR